MTSDYAWIITSDDVTGPDETGYAAGKMGPRDAPTWMLTGLYSGAGRTFKMYDDDDILYYTGRIVGEYDGFEPLKDFGMPGAGCTGIKYPGSGPEYGGGKYL